ncbi:hypothetical protein WA158_005536 [Blastocystis sp. Blastoise]
MDGVDEFTGIVKATEDLDKKLDEITTMITPLLQVDFKKDFSKLSPAEIADYHTTIAKTITVCFEVYLRCQGAFKEDHPLVKEIKRIQDYLIKTDEALNGKAKPTMRIDTEATKRIIKHALAGNE